MIHNICHMEIDSILGKRSKHRLQNDLYCKDIINNN